MAASALLLPLFDADRLAPGGVEKLSARNQCRYVLKTWQPLHDSVMENMKYRGGKTPPRYLSDP
ncbi:MAG: hypothetical protein Q4D85_06125 [Corynebacterium sp.]|uniref:hypothetical protein n=1 Tax=Corynebacterium sp. TaxID=1720 RepID=UPI0026DD290B|nr:hypothetical protein [Corynebacterium sp.]MDO5098320.1 hypothetical protein [Corynebacterium sp.]